MLCSLVQLPAFAAEPEPSEIEATPDEEKVAGEKLYLPEPGDYFYGAVCEGYTTIEDEALQSVKTGRS